MQKSIRMLFPAERVGFEPTIPCGILAFQASALGQLRYLSIARKAILPGAEIISYYFFMGMTHQPPF